MLKLRCKSSQKCPKSYYWRQSLNTVNIYWLKTEKTALKAPTYYPSTMKVKPLLKYTPSSQSFISVGHLRLPREYEEHAQGSRSDCEYVTSQVVRHPGNQYLPILNDFHQIRPHKEIIYSREIKPTTTYSSPIRSTYSMPTRPNEPPLRLKTVFKHVVNWCRMREACGTRLLFTKIRSSKKVLIFGDFI